MYNKPPSSQLYGCRALIVAQIVPPKSVARRYVIVHVPQIVVLIDQAHTGLTRCASFQGQSPGWTGSGSGSSPMSTACSPIGARLLSTTIQDDHRSQVDGEQSEAITHAPRVLHCLRVQLPPPPL